MGNGKWYDQVSRRCRTPHRNRCTRCKGLQWPTYDAPSGTLLFPSYRDFCTCHSLETADVDAVVFTSGVSATAVWHDCPARSTCSDDHVVSADADIVIASSVGSACREAAAGPQDGTYQAVHCEPSSFAEPRGLQAARGMVLFTELHDEVGFSAAWCGVWEPLRERSSFAEATRVVSSTGNAYFCLKQGVGQQDKTTGGGHGAFKAGVAGVGQSNMDSPSHNNLSGLVALMVNHEGDASADGHSLERAHRRGLLLFTQLPDELGCAAMWCGIWEPLPLSGACEPGAVEGDEATIQTKECVSGTLWLKWVQCFPVDKLPEYKRSLGSPGKHFPQRLIECKPVEDDVVRCFDPGGVQTAAGRRPLWAISSPHPRSKLRRVTQGFAQNRMGNTASLDVSSDFRSC